MKSHGILSRYMRPGFKEGGDSLWDKTKDKTKEVWEKMTDGTGNPLYDLSAQHQEEKEKTTEEWRKEKYKYFRGYDVGLFERKRDQGDDSYFYKEYDPTQSSLTKIDSTLFDEEKIRDGTQMIFKLDADGYVDEKSLGTGFLGSQGFEDIPFMFYESQDDLDYHLDKTDLDDMLWGKPYKDDISYLDKVKERGKILGRGAVGFAKNLPEMAAGAYRFLQPIDALGGIGPYDTFYPKDEEQQKRVDTMYEFPGYSQMMRDKFGVEPWQTPSTIFDQDKSLYKETLVDDRMKAQYLSNQEEYDTLQLYSDDELRAELEAGGVSEKEIQEYLDIKNDANYLEDLEYMSDRDALSHDMPGAVASIAGTFPIALGPLGAVGQGANLISKGNKLSKMISKIKKPFKAKVLDANIGLGVPQGSLEYIGREIIPKSLKEKLDINVPLQATEDEDSIYPR